MSWFVGFVDGDGSIGISDDRIYLQIYQKNEEILNLIAQVFGFGVVYYDKKGKSYVYQVRNENCLLFYLILNGNIVLKQKIKRFRLGYPFNHKSDWVLTDYPLSKIPPLINTPFKFTLDDALTFRYDKSWRLFFVTGYVL